MQHPVVSGGCWQTSERHALKSFETARKQASIAHSHWQWLISLIIAARSRFEHGFRTICKSARKPEYEMLRAHMPLADIDQATLGQMAAGAALISPPKSGVLTDWSHDIQQCRNEIVAAATRSGLSAYVRSSLADMRVTFLSGAYNRRPDNRFYGKSGGHHSALPAMRQGGSITAGNSTTRDGRFSERIYCF
jgi:hypothetical protein